MAKHKDEKGYIKNSIDSIREELDSIEEEIEPKRAKTNGDPIVKIY